MSHTNDSWTFLYSSDYCMDEISPIISFQETIERLPPHIDFGLVDGARAKKKIPSLEKQINDLYKEAEKTWEKGGSVLIATEENTYAPLLYIKFHEENKKRAFPRPIYVDEDIIRSLHKMTCCSQDLNDDIKGRIRAHKNPFESWQLQLINKNDFQAIYKALASPSLIMTHPNDIEKEPLSEIFPLMAMSSKNMMAFALYLNRNDKVTWDFVKNDPTTIKHETTLNGILPEKKKLRFEPKCHIFNRGEHNKDYKYYTFQNHASRKQLNELRSNVSFDELSLFHEGSKPVLEKIYPKNE